MDDGPVKIYIDHTKINCIVRSKTCGRERTYVTIRDDQRTVNETPEEIFVKIAESESRSIETMIVCPCSEERKIAKLILEENV